MVRAVWVDKGAAIGILDECLPGLGAGEPGAQFLLVYDDDTPAAAAALGYWPDGARLGPVAVRAAHRRRGLGGLALRMLIRRAFNMGHTKQYVETPTEAEPFFNAVGFKAKERTSGITIMEREGDITGHC